MVTNDITSNVKNGDTGKWNSWKSVKRFSVQTVLFAITSLATIISYEVGRAHNINILKNQLIAPSRHENNYEYLLETRFAFLPDKDSAFQFPTWIDPAWNEKIISVKLEEDHIELFDNITKLNGLQILHLHGDAFSFEELAKLKRIKSLQWLILSGSDLSEDELVRLRCAMPKTFISN